MKKLFWIIALVLILPFTVFAEGKYANAGEVVKDVGALSHNYFSAGYTVENNMEIDGILFTAGNNVFVNGTQEYGFVAGNIINYSGSVERDLFIAGNSINVISSSSIGRDLFVAGNDITISIDLNGNAFIAGSVVHINSEEIKGNLYLATDNVSFSKDINIEGKLSYPEDAVINGLDKVTALEIEKYVDTDFEIEVSTKTVVTDFIYSVAFLIVTAYIANLLFPNLYKVSKEKHDHKLALKTIGVGALVLICLPIAAVVLMITLVGIPVSLMAIALYISCLYLAMTFAGNYIVVKLLNHYKKSWNIYLTIALGVLLLKVAYLIPLVGGLLSFICLLFGLGYVVRKFKEYRNLSKKKN